MRIGDFLSNSEEDVLRISKGLFIYFLIIILLTKKYSVKMYGEIEIYLLKQRIMKDCKLPRINQNPTWNSCM